MWFDNSPKVPLSDKVDEAVQAYEAKYGRTPNVCYVNPADIPEGGCVPENVTIESEASVLPNHIYVGVLGAAR
jgi:hypothetical protein